MRLISGADVAKHAVANDCWVVFHNKVYDLTAFLKQHPGGSKVLMRFAGKDGTALFTMNHPQSIIASTLPADCIIGQLDPATADQLLAADPDVEDEAPAALLPAGAKPSIDRMLSVFDFEAVAKTTLGREAWDYYSSGPSLSLLLLISLFALKLTRITILQARTTRSPCARTSWPSSVCG